MLSRAAERVYWAGRYLERAESTARIVQQYAVLLLDLPVEVGVQWSELVRIVGAAPEFAARGLEETRTDVLQYLISQSDSPSSLLFSLRMARDNIRNTRDLLPQECWEYVNELYADARQELPLAVRSETMFDTLSECIGRCQQINGALTGTMSHHGPYHFLTLGQVIERADMTSRIIDVAAASIRQNETVVKRYGSSLWTNVLKSVSGFQMYRQYCQPQVEGARVITFLLTDQAFPRAVACCLGRAQARLTALPQSEQTAAAVRHAADLLSAIDPWDAPAEVVSAWMDDLQRRIGVVHERIVDTWFLPGEC